MSNQRNYARAKAIEYKNKERLLKVNPNLNDKGGIYFLLREDENGFKYAYIGQSRESVGILTRLAQHLVGYKQHIDLSLKKHKLYSEENPYGWRVEFLNFPDNQLDEKEQFYIKQCALKGFQLRNVSLGGQSAGRNMINETKPARGYRDGVENGYKKASKEVSHLFEKHLNYTTKSDKPNKNQQKAVDKFEEFLSVCKSESEV